MPTSINTIDLLEQAIEMAGEHGFEVRTEPLEGIHGGFCRIGTRRCIFLDQTQPASEQLELVLNILRDPPVQILEHDC